MDLNHSLELMKKYRIDHALLREGTSLSYLLQHTRGWQVVMREKAWEGYYVLYAKTSGTAAISGPCVSTSAVAQH